jgi:hypothetical protein
MIETNLQEKRNPTQIVWRVVFPEEEYLMSNTKKHPKILHYILIQISQQKTNGKYFANRKIHTLLTFSILLKNPILVLVFVPLVQCATNSCPDCDSNLLLEISKNEATDGTCSLSGCTMQMSAISAADNFPSFGPCNQDRIKVHKHFASFSRE